MSAELAEFEQLVSWFQAADDPWFTERRGSKVRRLAQLQARFCPCEGPSSDRARLAFLGSLAFQPYRRPDVRDMRDPRCPRTIAAPHGPGCCCSSEAQVVAAAHASGHPVLMRGIRRLGS